MQFFVRILLGLCLRLRETKSFGRFWWSRQWKQRRAPQRHFNFEVSVSLMRGMNEFNAAQYSIRFRIRARKFLFEDFETSCLDLSYLVLMLRYTIHIITSAIQGKPAVFLQSGVDLWVTVLPKALFCTMLFFNHPANIWSLLLHSFVDFWGV